MKPKRCVICKESYEPRATFQKTCSPKCALEYVEKRKAQRAERAAREDRKKTREQIKNAKPLSYWAGIAQQAVNDYVRYRDRKDGCISCEKKVGNVWHAGHFFTTKARPELRFELLNIHKQCYSCNLAKSGNLNEYRPRLIQKIGQEAFDWLSGPHEIKHLKRSDYEAITAHYRAKLKEMKEKE